MSTEVLPAYTPASATFVEHLEKNVSPEEHKDAIQSAVDKLFEENNIGETMKNLTSTVISINKDFDKILHTVILFDSKNYRKKKDDGSPNGDYIQKFEPTWRGIKKSFNDYIWESREVATSGAGHAQAFHDTLLPMIADKDVSVADKKEELKYYIAQIDKTESEAKNMVTHFEDVSTRIGTFSTLFQAASKDAGLNIDAAIAKVTKEIEELDETIKKYKEIAEKAFNWMIGGAVVEGIGCAMILTGFLAPIGLIALVGGAVCGLWNAKEGYDAEEKVEEAEKKKAEKKTELARLTADKAEHEEIHGKIVTSMKEAETIGIRVLAISKVWAVIRTEAQTISDALHKAEGAPTAAGLKRYMSPKVVQQYAVLERVLKQYANLVDNTGPKPTA